MPADRKGFGHTATVVVGNSSSAKNGSRMGGSPESVDSRMGRAIVLTRTLDQTTALRG